MHVRAMGYRWCVAISFFRPLIADEVCCSFTDDTLARKVNTSDASVFADQFGCCPSRVWGFLWLVISFIFFALGVIVGLVAFKVSFNTFASPQFVGVLTDASLAKRRTAKRRCS